MSQMNMGDAMPPVAVNAVAENAVPVAFARIINRITDLDQAVNQLVQAIAPALGPVRPNDVDKRPDQIYEMSEVARALHAECDRLDEIVNFVWAVKERVEL